jgi:hypothetical protein
VVQKNVQHDGNTLQRQRRQRHLQHKLTQVQGLALRLGIQRLLLVTAGVACMSRRRTQRTAIMSTQTRHGKTHADRSHVRIAWSTALSTADACWPVMPALLRAIIKSSCRASRIRYALIPPHIASHSVGTMCTAACGDRRTNSTST